MGGTEIAGFRPQPYKTLQAMARKTAAFQRKINEMDVVQVELHTAQWVDVEACATGLWSAEDAL